MKNRIDKAKITYSGINETFIPWEVAVARDFLGVLHKIDADREDFLFILEETYWASLAYHKSLIE